MEGPETAGDHDRSGMIPRAVQQVFTSAESLKEQGWKVQQFKLDFREDIPRAAQYVNSDSVLQQCILCRLDVAICLQSIKSGGFLKIFSKHL